MLHIDGKTYVIKNRDMRASISQVMLKRIYPDGCVISEITGIGTVTYPASGINNYGLGITTTGFWSAKVEPDISAAERSQVFLNIHILLRTCKNVDAALALIKQLPVMNGLNVILADKTKACVVEITNNGLSIEWDNGKGVLYRTNHYLSDAFSVLNPERTIYPSTFMRCNRIGELLDQCYGQIRFQDLYRIMSDHENGINCICRHPEGNMVAQTVSTTLFVVEDKEIWTTLGNPCFALQHIGMD